ncbi:polymeric immunoglobulin receptor [Tupaia chinensis]|uniref:polymeric immunoglobulin receptor n=1 Tax=Tupaia chinensis TaxID=246437 RepID=UPI0002B37E5B|nr:polymeric immunoglobulin receptor [Tupaia chinensis]ELW47756.1 Polymeric immunoglobulin receptor [Tupaia chinensis]
MMLLLLTCLLAVFPGVSMKSPIFGPQEVRSVEGKSVSIRCFYPPTSVNRHTRKYWCRQGTSGRCSTLLSSEGYVSEDYAGRANLTNFPENGTFVMDIAQLTPKDTGHYKCGLGISSRGLFFDVSLVVNQGPQDDTQVYTEDLGKTVTINCPFKRENAGKIKSLYRKTANGEMLVTDTNGYVNEYYKGRIRLTPTGTSQLTFSVTINYLRPGDSATYFCRTGHDSSDVKNVVLEVRMPEHELVYGDLRGSVTFDCALRPVEKDMAKYLCRVGKEQTCEVLINTLKKRNPAFDGRIVKDENGLFSVSIAGLRKEDAGEYRCGANPGGLPQEAETYQAWQLFVNEETAIPNRPSVVKGVTGGSVTMLCPYNPKGSNSLRSWCHWEEANCPPLVSTTGLVNKQYDGRLALFEEPGNGTYTVILNQLTTQDAGFYWCQTDGDHRWSTTGELKVVEGEPSLKVPEHITAVLGETIKLSCHFPCKFYSYEKYWCKWSNKGCQALPSEDEGPSQAFVNCNQKSQIISLTLNQVTKENEGWYWCGVKQGHNYGETAAVHVTVEEKGKGSHDVSPAKANAPSDVDPANAASDVDPANAASDVDVVEPSVRKTGNKIIQDPRFGAEEKVVEESRDQASGSRGSLDSSSSNGQGGSSRVLVSTLVPLGLVLALGAVAVGVARVRHRKNVDRISIRSYRTDISMSDFENSRDFGANDNMGAAPVTQETSLEGKNEIPATTESIKETEEPKKAKRSSKEEADLAYTAFLLQSNNMATQAQDRPTEA